MVFKIHLPPLSFRSSLTPPGLGRLANLSSRSRWFLPLHHSATDSPISENKHLRPLKALIIRQGLINDKDVISEFARRCFDLGAPGLALSSFYFSETRNSSLQNLIVRHLCDFGLYEDVLSVYRACSFAGCSSDNYTFPFVLKACSALCEEELGKEIHCVVMRTGYGGNVIVQTGLVDFYSKIGRVDVARSVLEGMPEPDLVSWNAMIAGCSWNGFDHMALDALSEIWVDGLRPNGCTLANIIPVCTRLGCLNVGKALHGYAIKSGFHSDESLPSALISMYANNGDIIAARRLFDLSPVENIVTWNSIIQAYLQNLQPTEAYKLFHHMLLAGHRPNRVTFVSVLSCCGSFSSLSHGEYLHLHAFVIKVGLENHAGLASTLISMYAKRGCLDSAELIFHHTTHKNLLTWNSMISGYVHNGDWDMTFTSFHQLQYSAGFAPDSVSLISVVSACGELGALLLGKSAHAFSIRKGFDSHLNLLNLLLSFYSKCHQITYSFKVFQTMNDRSSISWNTMISGCVWNGEKGKAITLLQQMQYEGVEIDSVSLISILPCYNIATDIHGLTHGMTIHGYAVKSGFISDASLCNALITMYSNCDDLNAAVMLFNTMLHRSVISWNSLITGYLRHNLHDKVVVLFRKMLFLDHQKPNHVTLLNVAPACSNLLQGKSVHAYAVRSGAIVQSPVLLSSMIFMYSRFGEMASCFTLFELGDKWNNNISLWNAMVSVLVDAGDAEKAFAVFREMMLRTGLRPDGVSILGLISCFVRVNNVDFCHPILGFVIKEGFGINDSVVISNALIDLYAKCGDVTIARKLFDELVDKDDADAVSWSTMINAYGLHGDGEAAVALLWSMVESGLSPDGTIYLSVLSACSHSGLVEPSRNVLGSMLVSGMRPTMEHYACIVDLLGRTGNLDEAYDIVKRVLLPVAGGASVTSSSMLESLLGACRQYGNLELGIKIGELLVESKGGSDNSGSYVMLYNMYAGAGRYGDADKVRAQLEETRLRKVAGFSFA
ncbi:hypothetical protein Dimus_017147 [Dionaea muscipula]